MTPLEKLQKKQRAVVKNIVNRITMQYSFKNIKTWGDIYKWTGYDNAYVSANFTNANSPITYDEMKGWCKKLEDDLEKQLKPTTPKEAPIEQVETSKQLSPEKESFLKEFEEHQKVPTVELGKKEPVNKRTNDFALKEVEKMRQEKVIEGKFELEPSVLEKCFLFYFQRNAAAEAVHKIKVEKLPAIMIIGGTGVGKTFTVGAILRRLMDAKWEDDKSFGVTPYIYVTRSSIVEKTKRDLKHFSINHPDVLEVINIEMLRSRAGKNWVKEEQLIIGGEEQWVYSWHKMLNPVVVVWDECQALKNEGSTQHKVGVAFSAITTPTTQIFMSATPFQRVSEAKAFCIATKMNIERFGFPVGTRLTEVTWPTFAQIIAGEKTRPDEYNEAAMDRLADAMKDYIVRIKNVRWQFNPINEVKIIDFSSKEEREEYDRAWERYQIKKAKLEEEITDNPRFRALVELGQFLSAAEYCKREIFAWQMHHDVQEGYASYLAVKQKRTLIAVVKILIEKYGVQRDQIALIWGGGQTQLTDKQKMKKKVEENMALFEEAGITLEDLALQDVEDRNMEELPEQYRLGMQSLNERQKEINRYQSGKAIYCIYTYKAGGVGLSLHHSDEWVKEKVRRKPDSGYAVEEDIPKIPVRQRKGTIGPTWSAIDLAQGSGRGARLTSLSDTPQCFMYYRGTVEEPQADVVIHKLRCIGKVVKQRENWTVLIEKYEKANEIKRELIESTKGDEHDSSEHDEDINEEGEE